MRTGYMRKNLSLCSLVFMMSSQNYAAPSWWTQNRRNFAGYCVLAIPLLGGPGITIGTLCTLGFMLLRVKEIQTPIFRFRLLQKASVE